jgi:predicted RNA-binding Zn-ribbon protein involved in translation (DUF1610 family)
MSRPVTIHSDGTGRGTVVLTEDGEQVGGVTDVTVSIAANGVATATIEVQHVSLNMKADVADVLYHCPLCGDMMEHHCESTMGGSVLNQCPSKLIERDPWVERHCIRGNNHPDSHFDGTRAWP